MIDNEIDEVMAARGFPKGFRMQQAAQLLQEVKLDVDAAVAELHRIEGEMMAAPAKVDAKRLAILASDASSAVLGLMQAMRSLGLSPSTAVSFTREHYKTGAEVLDMRVSVEAQLDAQRIPRL